MKNHWCWCWGGVLSYSVRFDIPALVAEKDLRNFILSCGSATPPQSIKLRVSGGAADGERSDANTIRQVLEAFGPLVNFDVAGAEVSDGSKRKAIAVFCRSEDACKAVETLGLRFNCAKLGNREIFMERIFAAKFSILNAIYAVLQDEIDDIVDLYGAAIRCRTERFQRMLPRCCE
jgi:hypothetical protein